MLRELSKAPLTFGDDEMLKLLEERSVLLLVVAGKCRGIKLSCENCVKTLLSIKGNLCRTKEKEAVRETKLLPHISAFLPTGALELYVSTLQLVSVFNNRISFRSPRPTK